MVIRQEGENVLQCLSNCVLNKVINKTSDVSPQTRVCLNTLTSHIYHERMNTYLPCLQRKYKMYSEMSTKYQLNYVFLALSFGFAVIYF